MNNSESRILELEYENSQLKRNLQTVLHLNEELRNQLKERDKKIEKLETKVSKLEKELEKYKVKPNEPSGAKPDYEKCLAKLDKLKKRGRKKGHKGVSRKNPREIHKTLHYKPQYCEHCNSEDLTTCKTRSKIITDLEIKLVNTKEILHDVKCKHCHKKTKALSANGDGQSPYGKTLQTLIAYLRSSCGMTIRPLEKLFTNFLGIPLTNSSISNNEIRLSKLCKGKAESYLESLQKSQFTHKDETTYPINGILHWIWTYDDGDKVFYRLSDNRGKRTLIKDFGKNPQGISINDCYGAYHYIENKQICWAHILRETKFHAQKENATVNEKLFHKKLKKLYHLAKESLMKDPPDKKRRELRKEFEEKLVKLMLSIKKKTEFLRLIINRLDKYLTATFLFVEVKDLPSTNNLAERDLRPFVIYRKASFGSKSFDGAEAKTIFKTIFENAKRQGILFDEVLDFIFNNYKMDLLTLSKT